VSTWDRDPGNDQFAQAEAAGFNPYAGPNGQAAHRSQRLQPEGAAVSDQQDREQEREPREHLLKRVDGFEMAIRAVRTRGEEDELIEVKVVIPWESARDSAAEVASVAAQDLMRRILAARHGSSGSK